MTLTIKVVRAARLSELTLSSIHSEYGRRWRHAWVAFASSNPIRLRCHVLPGDDRLCILKDYQDGTSFIHFELLTRQSYWKQLPWRFCGLCVVLVQPERARELARTIVAEFNSSIQSAMVHHRVTWLFMRGDLLEDLQFVWSGSRAHYLSEADAISVGIIVGEHHRVVPRGRAQSDRYGCRWKKTSLSKHEPRASHERDIGGNCVRDAISEIHRLLQRGLQHRVYRATLAIFKPSIVAGAARETAEWRKMQFRPCHGLDIL